MISYHDFHIRQHMYMLLCVLCENDIVAAQITPDGDEEMTRALRGIFEQFEEVAKAGGILRVRVTALFPCVSALIQDATSDNNETQRHPGMSR